MRNIKLIIEYDGTNFCGWQVQKNSSKFKTIKTVTIQGTIEKALRQILQEKIGLICSGRTDSGVHAKGQVANFKTKSDLPLKNIQKGLNSLLFPDIVVADIKEVGIDFHSRYDVKSKVYRYTILNKSFPSPFYRNCSHFVPYSLDINSMRSESRCLVGKHDFSSFQASSKRPKDPIRSIKRLEILKEGDFIHFDIEADGFLYNMVRNIVGALIEVGRGKLGRDSLKKILMAKDRRLAGPTAPARGLCLIEVRY